MGVTRAIQDTATLAGRTLRHNIRSVDTIMTVVGMPIMILLAFVFVIGGAIDIPGVRYVDFILPVVLLMCVSSGVSYTAFRVNADVASGFFSRLRAMPIARGAIVGGHVAASVVVNAFSVAIVLAFGVLIGYRPKAGVAEWGLTVVLLLLVLVAFTLMGVSFGLAAKSAEGASVFAYPVMGLLFVSSGFAPTSTMPGPLRAFADHQPMTPVIDAIRDAQLAEPSSSVWAALAWLSALIVVFGALARLAAGSAAKSAR